MEVLDVAIRKRPRFVAWGLGLARAPDLVWRRWLLRAGVELYIPVLRFRAAPRFSAVQGPLGRSEGVCGFVVKGGVTARPEFHKINEHRRRNQKRHQTTRADRSSAGRQGPSIRRGPRLVS